MFDHLSHGLSVLLDRFFFGFSLLPRDHHDIRTEQERHHDPAAQQAVDLIPEEFVLSGKFISTNRYERKRLLQKLDRTAAILVSRDVAEELLNMWKTDEKNLPFYVMEEALLPGIDTYIFHKNSPYMEKIEKCLQRDREFALSLPKHKKTPRSDSDRNRVVLLSVEHLKFVFFLLGSGLVASCVVFFAELIFIRKYCSVVSKK
jgi:hypothetical protein